MKILNEAKRNPSRRRGFQDWKTLLSGLIQHDAVLFIRLLYLGLFHLHGFFHDGHRFVEQGLEAGDVIGNRSAVVYG